MSILDVRLTPHDNSHSLRMDSVSSPDLFVCIVVCGKQLFGLIVIYQSGVNKSRRSTGMVQTVRITNVQRHTNISFFRITSHGHCEFGLNFVRMNARDCVFEV